MEADFLLYCYGGIFGAAKTGNTIAAYKEEVMIGQGGPKRIAPRSILYSNRKGTTQKLVTFSTGSFALLRILKTFGILAICLVFWGKPEGLIVANQGTAESVPAISVPVKSAPQGTGPSGLVRLNFSWCTEIPEHWNGEIVLSEGSFGQSVLLGNDSTGPAAFSFQEERAGKISFCTSKEILFCGVSTTLYTTPQATVTVHLKNPKWDHALSQTLTVVDLAVRPCFIPFDHKENGLLIERAYGDFLAIETAIDRKSPDSTMVPSDSMIFEQGDALTLNVIPRLLPPGTESDLLLAVQMRPADQDQFLYNESQNVLWDGSQKKYSFKIPIPKIEGAFELVISLSGKKGGFSLIPYHRDGKKGTQIAQRILQGVVVNSQAQVVRNDRVERPLDIRDGLLETIDPTNPAWWKVFSRNKSLTGHVKTNNVMNNVMPHDSETSPRILGQNAGFSLNMDFLKNWKWGDFQFRLTPVKMGSGWGQWDELWQHSIGSGHLCPYDEKDPRYAAFVQLLPDTQGKGHSWELYTIPVREPGKPHLLEIEYLSHVPQSLGISILEPSVSGGIFPTSIDSGLLVESNTFGDQMPNRVLSHQVLFWPRSKSPMILVMNRNETRPAVFGRLRLYRVRDNMAPPVTRSGGRMYTAMMNRPNFVDRFSAPRVASTVGVNGAENWNTVYTAVERMAQYLHVGGYDSLLFGVAVDGGTLYPSRLLRPTPRFDSGVFLPQGEDPVRKDVLEMTARIFQRESLTLIPMLNFNFPLPRLEDVLRQTRVEGNDDKIRMAEGIYWIGPEGRLLIDSQKSDSGTGPYYNILHPTVQAAMLEVVTELLQRYGRHRCLGGLAIELSTNGYAQLPDDIYYGMDDETIARFVKESRLTAMCQANPQIPIQSFLTGQGKERYRLRAQFIKDYCRDEWIQWRTKAVYEFYAKMRDILIGVRSDCRLYLTGTNMLDGIQSRFLLYPRLTRETNIREAIRIIGFDPALYLSDPSLVLLRPGNFSTDQTPSELVESLALDSTETARLFSVSDCTFGSVFYHESKPIQLPTFDLRSPFQPTVTRITADVSLNDNENRRRFSHRLAQTDSFFFMDGGHTLGLGQDHTMEDWVSVFHKIPGVPFKTWLPPVPKEDKSEKETVKSGNASSLQPVVVRYATYNNRTWLYLVNDASFHTNVRLVFKAKRGAKSQIYSGSYKVIPPKESVEAFDWSLTLRPYDLIAIAVDDPQTTINRVEVMRPEEICGPDGTLAVAMDCFIDRLLLARQGVPTPMINADFEGDTAVVPIVPNASSKAGSGNESSKFNLLKNSFAGGSSRQEKDAAALAAVVPVPNVKSNQPVPDAIPGWRRFGESGFHISLDSSHFQQGKQSLRLESAGAMGGIISSPIETMETGRLCLQLYFGVPENATALPLRVCLTGYCNGVPYQRQAVVGPALLARARAQRDDAKSSNQNGVLWVRDVVLFDRLPLEGLNGLSLRFDMLGAGTVWIDHLQIYKLAFANDEHTEIELLLKAAESGFYQNRIADSIDLLHGYWATLLERYIPDSVLQEAKLAQKTNNPPEEKPAEKKEPVKQARGFFGKLFPF